jgi:hypothetical protein
MQQDSVGHLYVEVGNVRLTYIPARDRSPEADWAGSDVIRVQAYKAPGTADKSLHRGAEFPVADAAGFVELIAGLCSVYNTGSRHDSR